jgi:hypothetical protein
MWRAVDSASQGVKLYVDLETLQLIEGPGFRNPVTSLRFKRGDAAKLEVTFLDGGSTAVSIGAPTLLEIRFGVKPRNRYDIGYLVQSDAWTMPAIDAESPVYQCSPSFNTEELDSALGVGSATGSELSEITLMGEITWREGSGEPTSTRTFLVFVENDVNRGTEGVPTSAEPAYPAPQSIELKTNKGTANGYTPLDASGKVPIAHLPGGILIDPTITTLTGTSSSALPAIVSTTLPLDRVLGIVINNTLSFYQLKSGTSATASPGIIRPNDYNATTNARFWRQIL